MTYENALDYLKNVVNSWDSWCNHHSRLVEAINVVLTVSEIQDVTLRLQSQIIEGIYGKQNN